MKRFIPYLLILILLALIIINKDTIYAKYTEYIIDIESKRIKVPENNEYARKYSFSYVQLTDDFIPDNKQDLLNILFTGLNSGQTSFEFYCSKDYTTCIEDVNSIAKDQVLISDINNFVHPFNSFNHIETKYDTLGHVTITTTRNYTEKQIEEINNKVNEIYNSIYNPDVDLTTNISNIHDYIVNNSKYDKERSDYNVVAYYSDIAYGPLLQGYALCGGYSDAMELFLEKLGVESFKVSSEEHVWNAVYLNDTWLHLDLTWDDPITTSGEDYLSKDYFLITTEQLEAITIREHNYDKNVYKELA